MALYISVQRLTGANNIDYTAAMLVTQVQGQVVSTDPKLANPVRQSRQYTIHCSLKITTTLIDSLSMLTYSPISSS